MENREHSTTNDLYFRIVHRLSQHENVNEPLSGILEDVCKHFTFGCGFIYETDYTNKFFLKEYYKKYDDSNPISEVINLLTFLSNSDINKLLKLPVFFSVKDKTPNDLKNKLLKIFNASTLLFVPIKGEHNSFIGFIALVDRRSRIVLDKPAIDAAKTILTIVGNFVKVRIYQQKVVDTKNSLLKVLDHTGIDIYVTDFDTYEILYVNKSMAAPYGGVENMIGKICWQVLYDDKLEQCDFCPKRHLVDEDGNPTKVYSWDYQRPFDGSWFRVFSAAFRWVDGRLAHVISSVDITENKHNEALVRRLAEYDTLTNIPNRHKLLADCDASIERMKNRNQEGYFLFFDLDNFKHVNDTRGHLVGDELLRTIASTLQDNPLTKDRVYRHGGDEFVILCENSTRQQTDEIVDYILTQFRKPWQLESYSPICHASIGISHFPNDGETVEEILQKADIAMYAAKRNGRDNAQFFAPSMSF